MKNLFERKTNDNDIIMHIICDRDILRSAIAPTLYTASIKATNPITEGFHLIASDNPDSLTITGFDLEKGIRTMVLDIKVISGGELVVNASKFAHIIDNMPAGEITITADDNYMLTIFTNRSRCSIHATNAKQYPKIPGLTSEKTFRIQQSSLKKMISETLFAVATNHMKPQLTGALFEIKDDIIKIVGIDGYKVACRKENGQVALKDKTMHIGGLYLKFIVPGKSLSCLQKILKESEKTVDIEISKKYITARTENIMFFSRLIEGEYMDYESAIPKDPPITAVVDRKMFIECIERAAIMMEQNSVSGLRLNFAKNKDGTASVKITRRKRRGIDNRRLRFYSMPCMRIWIDACRWRRLFRNSQILFRMRSVSSMERKNLHVIASYRYSL